MNNIKEINGKYYQECEVVMLATDQAKAEQIYLKPIVGILNEIAANNHNNGVYNVMPQHLYFLSNEEIKEGDWCYNSKRKSIELGKYMIGTNEFIFCKKIIATTDTSLRIGGGTGRREDGVSVSLPQPSKAFIQAYIKVYNKNKPITKVLVEYKEVQTACFHNIPTQDINQLEDCWELVLKLNSSNEITIKKVKDSYTREEYLKGLKFAIEQAIQYPELFITGICCDNSKISKFFEENL